MKLFGFRLGRGARSGAGVSPDEGGGHAAPGTEASDFVAFTEADEEPVPAPENEDGAGAAAVAMKRSGAVPPGADGDAAASGARQRSLRNPVRAEPEEERFYSERYEGLVYTGEGGPLQVGRKARKDVAVVDRGTILVAGDAQGSDAVAGVLLRAERQGIALHRALLVARATLLKVYAGYEARLRAGRGGFSEVEEEDSEARNYIKAMFDACGQTRASDIHIAVLSDHMIIWQRVDGRIENYDVEDREFGIRLLRACYVASSDNTGGDLEMESFTEARINGDRIALPGVVDSVRCQYMPLSSNGTSLVMRLIYNRNVLESGDGAKDETGLGYWSFHVRLLRQMRWASDGMVLIAGITGSGKSTTLQQTIETLVEEREHSITAYTIEDPPEFPIAGARQIPVIGKGEERETGFVVALRAVLRADPDIIMVGEIRDYATAALGIRSAHTGHLVFSTVHATSATRALLRLIDQGVERAFLLDDALIKGLIGQRLVQALCPRCSVGWSEALDADYYMPTFAQRVTEAFAGHEDDLHSLVRVRRRVDPCGEDGCRSGYAGRTVVAELVIPDEGYMKAFADGGPRKAEDYWLEHLQGLRMVEHGLAKMLAGEVDPLDLDNACGLRHLRPDRYDLVRRVAVDERRIAMPAVPCAPRVVL